MVSPAEANAFSFGLLQNGRPLIPISAAANDSAVVSYDILPADASCYHLSIASERAINVWKRPDQMGGRGNNRQQKQQRQQQLKGCWGAIVVFIYLN